MKPFNKKNLSIDKTNWKPVKFGDVVVEPKESVKDALEEGIEHVVGLEHIDPENVHLKRSAGIEESTTFTKKFSAGDVLFGRRRAYLKKAAQATFNGICSGDITVMRTKGDLISELLPFVVQNDKFFDYAIKHSAGGLSPRVKFKDLANYEFLLPPKDQQTRLSELFWSMDEVIERDLKVHSKLEQSKKALQRFFFERRFENWICLEDCSKIFSGGTPNRKETEYWDGTIPWLKTAEVNYTVIFETEEKITEKGLKNSAAKMIAPNSVLVAMYGQGVTRGRVALTGIPLSCNQACAVIEPNETVLSEFICLYLEYKYEELRALAHGANQQNLNLKMIKSFKIPVLALSQIKTVVEYFNAISAVNSSLDSRYTESTSLQKSLINKVF